MQFGEGQFLQDEVANNVLRKLFIPDFAENSNARSKQGNFGKIWRPYYLTIRQTGAPVVALTKTEKRPFFYDGRKRSPSSLRSAKSRRNLVVFAFSSELPLAAGFERKPIKNGFKLGCWTSSHTPHYI